MSNAQTRATRPLVNGISLLLLIGVLTVVMFAALRSPLKDDIAWLLYVARRWMAGRELYVDVIEVNPPLIVWISAIPLAISNWLSVNPQFVALPAFAAIVLGCAWWCACLLRPIGGLFAARMPVFAVIGSTLLFIPAADLGQREHLLVAAFLPYLILFARSLAPGEAARLPSTAVSLAAGILAALGWALKPQYGLVFVALEIVALRHRMRPWRPAPMAAAAAMVGYVGLVAYACPAYLRHAVPMAMALYGATDVSFLALFKDSAPLLAAEALVVFFWWRDRRDLRVPSYAFLLQTGMIFAAASTVVCFIDGKDWFYHRLPATVVTVLMLVLWAVATISRRSDWGAPGDIVWRSVGHIPWPVPPGRTPGPTAARTRWAGLIVAAVVVALFCGAAVRRLEPQVQQAVEPKATTVARLEALIRLHHARTYIAFSEWIALGFPVVNNTGVVWASRFDSMWALKGELWRAHIDPAAAKEWPITHWVAHDFIATCPDIAVVDTREGLNYIAVLSAAEPSFAHAWSRYKQIVAFDGLKVFKHGKGGCIDPWVAAEGPGDGTTVR
jgi:hypothetical protein